jgi:hypothetical protein
MSTRSAHFIVDTLALKPSVVLRTTAEAGAAVGLTHRMMADLAEELGGYEPALEWLAELATMTGRPCFVNQPAGRDTSTTVAIPPRGWGEERLAGYIGGMAEPLERSFGPAELRRMDE